MLKNKILIAMISLAVVIGGISTVIFLDESVSDGVEVENTEIIKTETVSKVEDNTSVIIQNTVSPENSIPYMGGTNSEPTGGIISAELSNLPLLNEVVTLTVTLPNDGTPLEGTENDLRQETIMVYFENGWEFVNIPQDEITAQPYRDGGSYPAVLEEITITPGEPQTYSLQIKPIQEGFVSLGITLKSLEDIRLFLHVTEDRTIPGSQYYEENPQEDPANNEPESKNCINEWCEPEPINPENNNVEQIPKVENKTTDPVLQEDFEGMCKNYDSLAYDDMEKWFNISNDSVEYSITGGELLCISHHEWGFLIFIDAVEEGLLVITIPNSLPDDSQYSDASSVIDPAILLVNGKEVKFDKITTTADDTTYSISFTSCGQEIEIIRNHYFP